MNRVTQIFLMGALLGSISTFAVRNGVVNAQAIQPWSKSEVTPILFVKPSFGMFVPSDGGTFGISWSKDQALPICPVKPSVGGFEPVDGMAIGNTWTKSDVKPVVFVEPYLGMFVARSDEQIGSQPAVTRPSSPLSLGGARSSSCNAAIETHIDGDFNGWDDEVIYKMDDGSIWQQSNYHYHYHYTYHPSVTIYPTRSGVCHIKVEGDDDEGVDVNRIK